MFQPKEVHAADVALTQAQHEAIMTLSAAVGRLAVSDGAPSGTPPLALISWALAHGLAVLARDGALQTAAATDDRDVADLVHTLIDLFSEHVGQSLVGVRKISRVRKLSGDRP